MNRKRSIFQKYRILPLLAVGIVFIILYTALGLLIWTLTAYTSQTDPQTQTFFPAFLYLSSIFLACCIMTALIKGGTVFPAAILAVAAAIATFILSDSSLLTFGSGFLKALLSLLVGVLGFTLTKLYFIFLRGSFSKAIHMLPHRESHKRLTEPEQEEQAQ